METNESPLKILLITDDLPTREQVCVALAPTSRRLFELLWVHQLSEGLDRLSRQGIAAVLLDLSLPDSHGIETFDKLFAAAHDAPILVVSRSVDESLAEQAVERGAQDYILPGHLDSYSLPRALSNAIERKAAEDLVYLAKERAEVTLNSIGDAVLCTDISGRISYLNAVAELLTGWSSEEALNQPLCEVFHIVDGVTRKRAQDPMKMAVEQDRAVGLTDNCILIRPDGRESAIEDSAAPIHDRAGRVIGAVIVFHDVSEARAMSIRMTYAAYHDPVTQLPNRLLLDDRISQAIVLAARQKRPIAVMFLDLDHFKYINDSLGHAVGDGLLQSVSRRLVSSLRSSDTVSRQGGDEFVILLPEIAYPEDAAKSATRILRSLNESLQVGGRGVHVDANGGTINSLYEPSESATKLLASLSASHRVGDQDLNISASIGISVYPGDGKDAETLIQNADMAMYQAKEKGRNSFQFYTPEMNSKAIERQSVEVDLRRAIQNGEFLLHYQPRICLGTGEITGVEALIRWQQPERGLTMPGQFVTISEECGLIAPIGRWVLKEACRQARSWRDLGLKPVPVAVNVSAVEFRDKKFISGIRSILAETGLETLYLELELTEGVLMQDVASTNSILRELKEMGIRLAMDDFGTGYSSLSYLRHFPIDVLKIDRSFVCDITADSIGSTLVSAIISMGISLKCLVVAEGIETLEQKSYLDAQHCAEGQGYLFSRPLPPLEFANLLQTGVVKPQVSWHSAA